MVIIVRNKIGNMDESGCVSLCANAIGKDMNLFSPAAVFK